MKRLSVWASLLFPVLCLFVFLGCGGGSDSTGATVPVGRVEGFVYLSSGAISLGRVNAPPPGPTLSGATITIEGRSGSTTADANGHFIVENVPVGQRVLHVQSDTLTLDVPITVIASATIDTSAYPISRSEAIQTAKGAASSLGTVSDFQILAPQQPLPAGTVIKPALGFGSVEEDPALTITLTSPHYLVFVDQEPGARFQHPAAYYLIDATTRALTDRNTLSWPRINGVSHYADDDKNAIAQDLVQQGTRKVAPRTSKETITRTIRTKNRDHVPGATAPKTYALLIQGNSRSDMAADLQNMKEQLFGEGGFSGNFEITTWEPSEEVNTGAKAQVLALFKNICAKARPEDTILIYVTSHGSKAGGFYLQQGIEADESVIEDDIVFPQYEMDTSTCAACHVTFILDTCYAGEQMVQMATQNPPHAGQKLTIMASSLSTETSGGVTKSNRLASGKALGGVFTNAFLNSLREVSLENGGAGQGDLQLIFAQSELLMPSKQHPQEVFKWDGAGCGAAPSLVSITPESVTAKHMVGATSCPQGLGNVTLKNISDHTVGYNLSLNSTYFNLSGSLSGSLNPGQSKSWGLSFNCGKVPPLEASIGVTATAEGEAHTQTLSVPVTLQNGP